MKEIFNNNLHKPEYIISAEEKEIFAVAVRYMASKLTPVSAGDDYESF